MAWNDDEIENLTDEELSTAIYNPYPVHQEPDDSPEPLSRSVMAAYRRAKNEAKKQARIHRGMIDEMRKHREGTKDDHGEPNDVKPVPNVGTYKKVAQKPSHANVGDPSDRVIVQKTLFDF